MSDHVLVKMIAPLIHQHHDSCIYFHTKHLHYGLIIYLTKWRLKEAPEIVVESALYIHNHLIVSDVHNLQTTKLERINWAARCIFSTEDLTLAPRLASMNKMNKKLGVYPPSWKIRGGSDSVIHRSRRGKTRDKPSARQHA